MVLKQYSFVIFCYIVIYINAPSFEGNIEKTMMIQLIGTKKPLTPMFSYKLESLEQSYYMELILRTI